MQYTNFLTHFLTHLAFCFCFNPISLIYKRNIVYIYIYKRKKRRKTMYLTKSLSFSIVFVEF